jgi:hypothetical protein
LVYRVNIEKYCRRKTIISSKIPFENGLMAADIEFGGWDVGKFDRLWKLPTPEKGQKHASGAIEPG